MPWAASRQPEDCSKPEGGPAQPRGEELRFWTVERQADMAQKRDMPQRDKQDAQQGHGMPDEPGLLAPCIPAPFEPAWPFTCHQTPAAAK